MTTAWAVTKQHLPVPRRDATASICFTHILPLFQLALSHERVACYSPAILPVSVIGWLANAYRHLFGSSCNLTPLLPADPS